MIFTINRDMNKILKILFLVIVCICLSGCAQVARDPYVPIGLLTKSREFLVFCLFLVDSGKNYYNQIATRYYYSMFTIAKLNSLWKHKSEGYSFEKQDAVWSVQKHEPKVEYGDKLKRLRVECDYLPEYNEEKFEHFRVELSSILNTAKPFVELMDNAEEVINKYYSDKDKQLRDRCLDLLSEIRSQNELLKNKLKTS